VNIELHAEISSHWLPYNDSERHKDDQPLDSAQFDARRARKLTVNFQ
jgi:hypothetical protein